MTLAPVSIKRTPDHALKIVWSDGHSTRFALQYLRDRCPCAGCSGEADLFGRVHMPAQPVEVKAGGYDLVRVTLTGSYAMTLAWGDGHAEGIYSWNYLLALEHDLDMRDAPEEDHHAVS